VKFKRFARPTLLLAAWFGSTGLFGQSSLTEFVDALKRGDTTAMRGIVISHQAELIPTFFGVLQESASQLETDREVGQRYVLLAAALAQSFSAVAGNALYPTFENGSALLEGRARSITSDSSLAAYLTNCLDRYDTYSVARELRSIVRAHERDTLPEPLRRLMEMAEKAKAERAQREAAERERREKAEEEEKRRQYMKRIADLTARKDLSGLRKMFNEVNATDQWWQIYDALIRAGDVSIAADVAKGWIGRIGGDDAAQRAQAQEALKRIGAAAVPTILAQLKDQTHPDLNLALARLLVDMQTSIEASCDTVFVLLVQHNLDGIAKLGPDARPAVVAALRANDSQAVVDALMALGRIGSEADLPAVEPLLSAPDAATRQAAQSTMWQLAHSIPGRIRAAAKIAPILFTLVTALLVTSVWWLPRLIRIINPPFVERLAQATQQASRESALSAAGDLLMARRRPLPSDAVHALEDAVRSGKPEMLVLLAFDAERRHDSQAAAAKMTELWDACTRSVDATWIVPKACAVMAGSAIPPLSDALRPFDEFVRAPHSSALVRLMYGENSRETLHRVSAELAALPPLPEVDRKKLEERSSERPACLQALLKDAARLGNRAEAIRIAELLEEKVLPDPTFPDWILEEAIGTLESNDASQSLEAPSSRLKAVRILAGCVSREDRGSLRKALASLPLLEPLSTTKREALASRAARLPQLWLILAADALYRANADDLRASLASLQARLETESGVPDWVVDEGAQAHITGFSELVTMANRLKASRKLAALLPGRVPDKPDTLRKTLTDLAHLGPLPIECRVEIEKTLPARPDLATVLLDDDLRAGRIQEASTRAEWIAEHFIAEQGTPSWIVGETIGVVQNRAAESKECERMSQLLRFAERTRALLVKTKAQKDIAGKLAEIRSALEGFGAPLPAGVRSTIEKRASGSVEVAIILATDDSRRGARAAGLERLFGLMKGMSPSHRAAAAVVDAWSYEASRADFAVQRELRRAADAGNKDAWTALALTILISGKTKSEDYKNDAKVAHGAK
jgi:hypothetical protein